MKYENIYCVQYNTHKYGFYCFLNELVDLSGTHIIAIWKKKTT